MQEIWFLVLSLSEFDGFDLQVGLTFSSFSPNLDSLDDSQVGVSNANSPVILALNVVVTSVWAPVIAEFLDWDSNLLLFAIFTGWNAEFGFEAPRGAWDGGTVGARVLRVLSS